MTLLVPFFRFKHNAGGGLGWGGRVPTVEGCARVAGLCEKLCCRGCGQRRAVGFIADVIGARPEPQGISASHVTPLYSMHPL